MQERGLEFLMLADLPCPTPVLRSRLNARAEHSEVLTCSTIGGFVPSMSCYCNVCTNSLNMSAMQQKIQN